jgi:hypothetical protein
VQTLAASLTGIMINVEMGKQQSSEEQYQPAEDYPVLIFY